MPHIIREVQAPYTVNLDDEAVERETIILQRDGVPVAAVVPYAVYREWLALEGAASPAPAAPPAPASDDPEFERNRAAFQRLLPELLKDHRGQWVGIVNEQAVVFGSTANAVLEELAETFGDVRIYIQQVLEKPRVYRMISRRVVRSVSKDSQA